MGYKWIKWHNEVSKDDVGLVGGKAANLGELASLGMPVPPAYFVTADAYRYHVKKNKLQPYIVGELENLDIENVEELNGSSEKIREAFENSVLPPDLEEEIAVGYEKLGKVMGEKNLYVAVRSSATAEDLPTASFAGQQDTYLWLSGIDAVVNATKKCFGSLFTGRAIVYRQINRFPHDKVYLAVPIQAMVNSRISGTMFTIEPNSGNENIISIDASYGLGEAVVSGSVMPDTIWVFKETCEIIRKTCGTKEVKIIPAITGTMKVETAKEERGKICILDEETIELAEDGREIERHYKVPMDVEWGIDQEGKLWILQARPETVYSREGTVEKNYILREDGKAIAEGIGIGRAIGCGEVRVIEDVGKAYEFKIGEVLVTKRTTPDWVLIMRKAAAIITEEGGPTCHAAIVSREMGKPCIVGVNGAIKKLGEEA